MNVIFRRPDWDSSGSQNLYGKLENMIRIAESRLGVLTSLFGSAFAVRKAYFKPLDADTGDDFIIPLDMALQGYKTVFEPNAIVYDDWSSKGLKSEIKVRQRITLRNFTGLLRRRSLLNPLKHFKLSFALFFHKVFRWLSPLFLVILFSTSFALRTEGFLYSAAFLAQLLAYFIAMVGIFSTVRGKPIIGASTLGTFVVANFGILMGLFSLLKGQRILGYRN